MLQRILVSLAVVTNIVSVEKSLFKGPKWDHKFQYFYKKGISSRNLKDAKKKGDTRYFDFNKVLFSVEALLKITGWKNRKWWSNYVYTIYTDNIYIHIFQKEIKFQEKVPFYFWFTVTHIHQFQLT